MNQAYRLLVGLSLLLGAAWSSQAQPPSRTRTVNDQAASVAAGTIELDGDRVRLIPRGGDQAHVETGTLEDRGGVATQQFLLVSTRTCGRLRFEMPMTACYRVDVPVRAKQCRLPADSLSPGACWQTKNKDSQ